jgi:hypothetical protein
MKRRKAYEKPSERKTREKAEAIRRARKAARKQAQREGLIPMPKKREAPMNAPARRSLQMLTASWCFRVLRRAFLVGGRRLLIGGWEDQAGEYGNLISKGIIDPTKVVRAALQGAASVAGLLITTEAMVAELPKKQGPAMPGGPGGGMGGMGGMDF